MKPIESVGKAGETSVVLLLHTAVCFYTQILLCETLQKTPKATSRRRVVGAEKKVFFFEKLLFWSFVVIFLLILKCSIGWCDSRVTKTSIGELGQCDIAKPVNPKPVKGDEMTFQAF